MLFALPEGFCQTGSVIQRTINDSSTLHIKPFSFFSSTALPKPLSYSKNTDPVRVDSAKNGIKPLIAFDHAMVSYGYDFRSLIDTPYFIQNLSQQQARSYFGFTLAERLPFTGSIYIRKSNSPVFRDIYDVQLQFDVERYKSILSSRQKKMLSHDWAGLTDSLAEKRYLLKKKEWEELLRQQQLYSGQQIVEAHEIIKIPQSTFDLGLADSINNKRYDSIRATAILFLQQYDSLSRKIADVHRQKDSLAALYEQALQEGKAMQSRMTEVRTGVNSLYKSQQDRLLNKMYQQKWLYHVRSLSLGRSTLPASDLTARNLALTGLHFEYNSWYYLAVSAGLIDYRFRDFIQYQQLARQYLYLLRLGIGRIDQSYIIGSYFGGRKQLFQPTVTNNRGTVSLSGLTVEGRWQWLQGGYIQGEIGQTITPSNSTVGERGKNWRLSDWSHKAISMRLYHYFPQLRGKVDAHYRYTGSGYQAFHNFQVNTAQKNWRVKYDQQLFRRRLRLSASMSRNDFANPFIIHSHSNTLFKTLQLTWQHPKWPVISIGYLPMSQTLAVENFVQEFRFQTFQGNVFHSYALGEAKGATTLYYTKYVSTDVDTVLPYHQAESIFATQQFHFKKLSITVGVSKTSNPDFQYTVFDEGIQLPLSRKINLGTGIKINQLNTTQLKTGGYIHSDIYLFKSDLLSIRFEQGYLPTSKGQLVTNASGSVQFTKVLK
jgi:hypothetical protein